MPDKRTPKDVCGEARSVKRCKKILRDDNGVLQKRQLISRRGESLVVVVFFSGSKLAGERTICNFLLPLS